jgi:predicted nucleotidyltransferase
MSVFDDRAAVSKSILKSFRAELKEIGADSKDACVYVTGSVARGEASSESDVDLFILDTADENRAQIALSNIDASLLRADLIRAGRKLGLPEFSGDGIYLDVHRLTAMVTNLGYPRDDYTNSFTARLLLMLESKPLLNKEAHLVARNTIAERYFRDYPANEKFFQPTFMANDILRYWKTLCLNYEAEQNDGAPSGYDAETWRRRNRLRNIKLKFSRMWMCHSALAYLLAVSAEAKTVSPEDALKMMELSPRQRFEGLAKYGADRALINSVLESYSWFLENLPPRKQDAYEWVGEKEKWQDARSQGQAFGDSVVDLLMSFDKDSALFRYLVG